MQDKIYMEVFSWDTEKSGEDRKTHVTGGSLQSKITELMTLDSEIIKAISDNLNEMFRPLANALVADEVEMEFSFGITASGKVCILSGNGSMGIKVKVKWKK